MSTAALGTIVQLSTSDGGMPKYALLQSLITRDGLPGDWQKNRKYHGGRDRAVCLFSLEQYDWLRKEHRIDLQPGSLGENVTTSGFDLQSISPGDRLQVGEAVVEITKVRVPCKSLKMWHDELHKIIEGNSGWLAKVLIEGIARPGDAIARIAP